MANPNILNVTTITGKTLPFLIETTPTAVLTNPLLSSFIYKINSLFIANVNGTTPADVTVEFFRSGIAYRLASTVSVLADNSLIVLGKETGIYLEEGDSIRVFASSTGYLTGVISFEILG